MKIKTASAALAALAHETRLAIFKRLVVAGPDGLAAGVLSTLLKLPPPTLSFHLKELEQARLVHSRRVSRNIIYTADFSRMRELLTFLVEDCCGGRPEICSLDVKTCCA